MSLAIQLKGHSSNRIGHIHLKTNYRNRKHNRNMHKFKIFSCLFPPFYLHIISKENAIYIIFPDETQQHYKDDTQISAKAK